jgi:hypothetical protein
MMKKLPQPDMKTEDVPDAVWGYAAIGREIGLSASQIRYPMLGLGPQCQRVWGGVPSPYSCI